MEFPLIQLEARSNGVALVTLNRPEKRNALNIALMESLCNALDHLATNDANRILILHGAGPVFCAGLDLTEAAQPERTEHSTQLVARLLQTVAETSLITIAAAHGKAVAGGAGLMAACDFAIATDDLRISFPEVLRGLVPALVATPVRGRVPEAKTRELFLLAREIDAHRALQIGLVDRVVAAADLTGAAEELAAALLAAAPNALRMTKQLLRETRCLSPVDAARLALEFHAKARASDEVREGFAAFAERRTPRWQLLE
jgi:methylglutaconyl-CoA hydratase